MQQVVMVFGEDEVDAVGEGRLTRDVLASAQSFLLPDEATANAFRRGVDTGCGWDGFAVICDDEIADLHTAQRAAGVKPSGPIDDHHAVLVFGTCEVAGVEEGEFNREVAQAATTYAFDSAQEKQAFLMGVRLGDGWMEYTELTGDELKAAEKGGIKSTPLPVEAQTPEPAETEDSGPGFGM